MEARRSLKQEHWLQQDVGKTALFFHGETAAAGWLGPQEVTACQMAWAPGRDKVEGRGITAFLLPCLWLRVPSSQPQA